MSTATVLVAHDALQGMAGRQADMANEDLIHVNEGHPEGMAHSESAVQSA